MNISYYQVDAFASKQFQGNPAGVCPLESWLPDPILQRVAQENNLSETAFFVAEKDQYHLRWFTPVTEVELCGHATLATAHVLFNHLNYQQEVVKFNSLSGPLEVRKTHDGLQLNFPLDELTKFEGDEKLLIELIGGQPAKVHKGKTDVLLVYNSELEVRSLSPRFEALSNLDHRGIIVTAPGEQTDVVSRFFCPAVGINEDPVTGSAHTTLGAYWPRRLASNSFSAAQLSERGGQLHCDVSGDRIKITGKAVTFMHGTIYLADS